jgi:mRNA interferase MazF
MKRGDFYRIYKGNKNDPKSHRVFVVVSRQLIVDSKFSTAICAPVHSKYDGFPSQVEVGALPDDKIELLNAALRIALAID